MNIRIEKSGDHYRADCLDLPGMPPVGIGDTPEMAVACLFWSLMFADTAWLSFIRKDEPLIVNDKEWEWPKSHYHYSRAERTCV